MEGASKPREMPPLPSPGVSLPPALLSRIGAFATHVSAAREREEVGRRRTLQGDGQEFVGHRPYRPGEDLRRFDWDLLARLDRPFVRVHRSRPARSGGSGSTRARPWGWGPRQAAVRGRGRGGHRRGAPARRPDHPGGAGAFGGTRPRQARADGGPRPGLGALEDLTATGSGGLEALLAGSGHSLRARAAGRVLLLGDLLDVDPASVLRLLGGRRRLPLRRVLAQWDPASGEAGAFVDPESGLGRWGGAGERSGLQQYERSLEAFLERWSGLAAAHGMSHRIWSTTEAFESFLPDLLR